MLISKTQFKQPPNTAGGWRLNPRLYLCSFLILDLLDTCRRVRAHLRRRRPLKGAIWGRVRMRAQANKALPQPVHTFWKCCTSVFQPQCVLRDSRSVQTNSQQGVGGGETSLLPPPPNCPLSTLTFHPSAKQHQVLGLRLFDLSGF